MASSKQDNPSLMDTAPGGESRNQYENQYETQKTFNKPSSEQGGQLSAPSEKPAAGDTGGVSEERGEQRAANMRYGQAISEQGVGGFTEPGLNGGEADAEQREGEDVGQSRREQGYHGSNEVGKDIGA